MRDTRERIEIKHLKFSDIAQREFNKIMPNDLTQKYSRSLPRAVGSAMQKRVDDLLGPSEDDKLSSMEQIRQDLEDADNVFGIFYKNKKLKKRANSFDDGNADSRVQSRNEESLIDSKAPSVEWLPSSASERDKCDVDDRLGSLRDQDGRIVDTSEILNMTGVRELKHMERAREKLDHKSKKDPANEQVVLDK